jgi:hypothetical protein
MAAVVDVGALVSQVDRLISMRIPPSAPTSLLLLPPSSGETEFLDWFLSQQEVPIQGPLPKRWGPAWLDAWDGFFPYDIDASQTLSLLSHSVSRELILAVCDTVTGMRMRKNRPRISQYEVQKWRNEMVTRWEEKKGEHMSGQRIDEKAMEEDEGDEVETKSYDEKQEESGEQREEKSEEKSEKESEESSKELDT